MAAVQELLREQDLQDAAAGSHPGGAEAADEVLTDDDLDSIFSDPEPATPTPAAPAIAVPKIGGGATVTIAVPTPQLGVSGGAPAGEARPKIRIPQIGGGVMLANAAAAAQAAQAQRRRSLLTWVGAGLPRVGRLLYRTVDLTLAALNRPFWWAPPTVRRAAGWSAMITIVVSVGAYSFGPTLFPRHGAREILKRAVEDGIIALAPPPREAAEDAAGSKQP